MSTRPKIIVIGGGTGSFTVLSGLKNFDCDITAVVSMADDGGSTGQLRDELGVLPPGDIRQCLVALSQSPKMRELFNYRFDEGSLKGHAFGNLFLTALERMTGNFADGVELASEVLQIRGRVEPVTLSNVKLCMRSRDEAVVHGQLDIAHRRFGASKPALWLEPAARLNPLAKAAIESADLIVIAPGNLYGSLAPVLIVPGMGEALAAASAAKVYVCNLVTKPGQTDGYSVIDYADEIERFAGGAFLDYVLYNTAPPGSTLLKKYAQHDEHAVELLKAQSSDAGYEVIGADIIAAGIWRGTQASDPIAGVRTLIRHDSTKVARQLVNLLA